MSVHRAEFVAQMLDILFSLDQYSNTDPMNVHRAEFFAQLLDILLSLDQYSNTDPLSVHRAEFFAQIFGILHSPPSTVFCICAAVHTALVL